jgi:hypothetical protein
MLAALPRQVVLWDRLLLNVSGGLLRHIRLYSPQQNVVQGCWAGRPSMQTASHVTHRNYRESRRNSACLPSHKLPGADGHLLSAISVTFLTEQ